MPRYLKPVPRFYLHKKNGEYYIFLTIRFNNQLVRLPLSKKIAKRYWNAKQMRCRELAEIESEAIEINALIESYEAAAKAVWQETKGKVDAAEFRLKIEYKVGTKTAPATAPTDLISAAKALIAKNEGKKPAVVALHTRTLKHLEAYANTGANVAFEAITPGWIEDFLNFMYARNLFINTAMRSAKVVKQWMRFAQGEQWHNNTAYQAWTADFEETDTFYLYPSELDALKALNLSPSQSVIRDLFFIGVYTGLAFAEFTSIRPDMISTEAGRKVITITRGKTQKRLKIPILKELDAILAKYGYTSPQVTNQHLNDGLKVMAREAGLNRIVNEKDTSGGIVKYSPRPLHSVIASHCARRTFATLFYLIGVDVKKISALLGHTTEKQTREYIGADFMEMAEQFADDVTRKTNLEFA